MSRRLGIAGVALVALLVAAAAAAAGSGWKVQRSPNPPGSTSAKFEGVSCASASACMAVGDFTTSSAPEAPLAERRHAGKWSIESTPSRGNGGSYLLAASCTAAKACTAVGSYSENGRSVPLAERWNGTRWAVQRVPKPAGSTGGFLQGVSCTSGRACTAVGGVYRTGGIETLAERWNGKHWSVQHTPSPAGATTPVFYGVSCASAKACVAVGDYENRATVQVTLAERWNGKQWSAQHTRNPAGTTGTQFIGISCTSAGACTAVGQFENGAHDERTLAERWNGRKWAIQHTRNPTTNPNKQFNAVSCTSATSCTAAGDTTGRLIWDTTLVEHWNGDKWSVQRSPDPGPDNELNGVSCGSASSCTAAGWRTNSSSLDRTLVEHR